MAGAGALGPPPPLPYSPNPPTPCGGPGAVGVIENFRVALGIASRMAGGEPEFAWWSVGDCLDGWSRVMVMNLDLVGHFRLNNNLKRLIKGINRLLNLASIN